MLISIHLFLSQLAKFEKSQAEEIKLI